MIRGPGWAQARPGLGGGGGMGAPSNGGGGSGGGGVGGYHRGPHQAHPQFDDRWDEDEQYDAGRCPSLSLFDAV